jgi:hypothetical protein
MSEPRTVIDCPHARSENTPCVARDGQLAVLDNGTCVGCEQYPANLFKDLVKKYTDLKLAAPARTWQPGDPIPGDLILGRRALSSTLPEWIVTGDLPGAPRFDGSSPAASETVIFFAANDRASAAGHFVLQRRNRQAPIPYFDRPTEHPTLEAAQQAAKDYRDTIPGAPDPAPAPFPLTAECGP